MFIIHLFVRWFDWRMVVRSLMVIHLLIGNRVMVELLIVIFLHGVNSYIDGQRDHNNISTFTSANDAPCYEESHHEEKHP